MNNITLITSIINISSNPLSYTNIRSVYTREERFIQTKNTIKTVREKIANNKILLVECSLLNDEERKFFIENTDYFLNLHDLNDHTILQKIHSNSKSMGEGTMTIYGIEYLLCPEKNIQFDNLFKITGRYWLNDKFNYYFFDNKNTQIYNGDNEKLVNSAFTFFYKLSYDIAKKWLYFLKKSENDFINCVGYENIFYVFLNTLQEDTYKSYLFKDFPLGLNGNFSVDGCFLNV